MPVMTMLLSVAGEALAVCGLCSSVCWVWSAGGEAVCAWAIAGAARAMVEPLASRQNMRFLCEAAMPPLSPVWRNASLSDAYPYAMDAASERSLCQAASLSHVKTSPLSSA
jgi:hypothetical protein